MRGDSKGRHPPNQQMIEEKKQQVTPALRLQADRYGQPLIKETFKFQNKGKFNLKTECHEDKNFNWGINCILNYCLQL